MRAQTLGPEQQQEHTEDTAGIQPPTTLISISITQLEPQTNCNERESVLTSKQDRPTPNCQ